MKFRAVAVPLITVDPYFSVWSMTNQLNSGRTYHWTEKENPVTGIIEIDNEAYTFMGISADVQKAETQTMRQKKVDVSALSTTYLFESGGVELKAVFTTPLLMSDLSLLSRPVSYLHLHVRSTDRKIHKVKLKIYVSEEICLDEKGQLPVETRVLTISEGIASACMGAKDQRILNKCGDDVRIDWGYFYLSTNRGTVDAYEQQSGKEKTTGLCAQAELFSDTKGDSVLFTFAYDDLYSIEYFGEKLEAYWKKDGQSIESIIKLAFEQYNAIIKKCKGFSSALHAEAVECGGEKYADLLALAYRQVIAAHKLVLNTKGELLFISKECFSNGCAATADVSYPSVPLFLIYNPDLVEGMLRPIFDFAASSGWHYEFAPHDAGRYPLLNGQVYGYEDGNKNDLDFQMPVEECGNMILMTAAACIAKKDFSFAKEHMETLRQWADYLVNKGLDPENQLCTDDFAGHLAHNCNLSVKAIMAIAAYAILCERCGDAQKSKEYMEQSKKMAAEWTKLAANGDGSFMLTFHNPGTFSLKYNLVWDVLFGTNIFDKTILKTEAQSYIKKHLNRFGIPLDSRNTYTKSDWMLYCAELCHDNDVSQKIIESLWNFYNESPARVPMTDWFDTVTAQETKWTDAATGKKYGFQSRSVQGGLFIKILRKRGICLYKNL